MSLRSKLEKVQSASEAWLLLRMLGLLLRLPRLIERRSLPEIVRAVSAPAGCAARFDPVKVTVYAGFWVHKLWFARRRPCLFRSLLLYRFLPEAGVAPTIFFGARKGAGEEDPLAGHAWIQVGGQVVADTHEHVGGYTVAYTASQG